MTKVKICGIQQLDHAIAAAEAGADFIGLVFVPQRQRCLTVDAAKTIVSGLMTCGGKTRQLVGLFADQPLEEVDHLVRASHLDLVQLCGNESLEYCRQVGAAVIKVLHVPPLADPVYSGPFEVAEDGLGPGYTNAGRVPTGLTLPPTDVSGPGSTCGRRGLRKGDRREEIIGELASAIRSYREAGHLVALDRRVAGLQGGTGQTFDWGIAAELSRRGHSFLLAGGLTPDNVAQAVATAQPWGVDVSSGVETGGIKDPDKIRAFIHNARHAGE
jgi:phosphoribosylanthranilate isomerase